MTSLIQGFKNLKSQIGTAAHELQHVANLLQPGTSADEKKFLEAVCAQNPKAVEQLLSANPNVIFARTRDWHNAWHIAAASGHLPMLEVLHTHGRGATRKPLPGEPPHYAARTRDKRETPLMLACANEHLPAMQYLLGAGASILDGDKYGNTVVHYAALKGQVKLLSLLLATSEAMQSDDSSKTRLVDVRNEAGLQPLHFAVWGGNPETLQVILGYRPDLVAKSISDSMAQVTCNGGSTPLHVAALKNDPALVNLLLNEYVKVTLEGRGPRSDPRTVTDNYTFTPEGIAKDLNREAVIKLLDPIRVLKGLEPGAVAAAAAAREAAERHSAALRRSQTRSGRSSSEISPASKSQSQAPDPFDGFSLLAAGHAEKKAQVPVPILPPPPPKAGKAVAATVLQVLAPGAPAPQSSDTQGEQPHAFRIPSTVARTPSRPGSASKRSDGGTPVRDKSVSQPETPTQAAGSQPSLTLAGKLASASLADRQQPSDTSAPQPSHTEGTATHSTGALTSQGSLSAPTDVTPPPEAYLCPITQQIMSHPVIAGDGRAYEADAIQVWLSLNNDYFPGGSVKVLTRDLIPAAALKQEIQEWKRKHKAGLSQGARTFSAALQ